MAMRLLARRGLQGCSRVRGAAVGTYQGREFVPAAALAAAPGRSLWTATPFAIQRTNLPHGDARAWNRSYSSDFMIPIPAMGESITEGSIAAILKGPGETVAADEVIAQIETDKVTIDVRAPSAGTIASILVKEDDNVVVGQPLCTLTPLADGQSVPAAAAAAAPPPPPPPEASAPPPPQFSPTAAAAAKAPAPPAAAAAGGARVVSIKFPPRTAPDGRRISDLAKAEQVKILADLLKAAGGGKKKTVEMAFGVTQVFEDTHPPRRVLLEREIEMINLGGASG